MFFPYVDLITISGENIITNKTIHCNFKTVYEKYCTYLGAVTGYLRRYLVNAPNIVTGISDCIIYYLMSRYTLLLHLNVHKSILNQKMLKPKFQKKMEISGYCIGPFNYEIKKRIKMYYYFLQ
jgi:hypothetical protein